MDRYKDAIVYLFLFTYGDLHSSMDRYKAVNRVYGNIICVIYIPVWIDIKEDYFMIYCNKCKFTFQYG